MAHRCSVLRRYQKSGKQRCMAGSSVPPCAPPHTVCCSVVLLAVQHLCVSPGCDVCRFALCPLSVLGVRLVTTPAGNCVSLSCLLLGLFWLLICFLFVGLFSDLQLMQIMLAANDCRKKKKNQNTKEKKKKGASPNQKT